jgi:hypothetical protein
MRSFAAFFSALGTAPVADAADGPTVGLHDVLAPLPVRGFLANDFLRRAVRVPSGGRQRLPFFSLERFGRLIKSSEEHRPPGFALDANFRDNPDDSLFEIRPSQVGHLLDAGATVCATNIHLIDPALHSITRELKTQMTFSGVVGVNCYLSAHGAGFRMHFDSKSALIVQIEGAKHWTYGRTPALEFPRRAGRDHAGTMQVAHADLPFEEWEKASPVQADELSETLLTPGDVLWLPPGAWHEARAEGFSLALTFAFQPVSFATIIWPVIAAELRRKNAWRGGPPSLHNIGAEEGQDQIRSYFEARLGELRDIVCALDGSDSRIWKAWQVAASDSRAKTR